MVLYHLWVLFAGNAVSGRKTTFFCEKFSALFCTLVAAAKRVVTEIRCFLKNIFYFYLFEIKNYCIFLTLKQQVILQ